MDTENFTFLSTRVLPSGCATLYNILNARLFLLLQLISHIEHSLCCNSCSTLNIFLDLSQYFTVNAARFNFQNCFLANSRYLTQNSQPSNNGCLDNQCKCTHLTGNNNRITITTKAATATQ